MRRRLVIMVVASGTAAWCALLAGPGEAGAGVAPAGSAAAAVSWHTAIEVPGSAALNAGGDAEVRSVSCGAAGSCVAGGRYEDGSGHDQAFVASEKRGRWGKAVEVPGSGALNVGGSATVNSVSCVSPGSCAAGGFYEDGSGYGRPFVVSEKNGRWGKAIKVPGSGALSVGGSADVNSVSCGSTGSCAAGGGYTDGAGHEQAFVVSEKNGRWGKAIKVPGSGALNAGGAASISSVSCGAAGSCAAGGFYEEGSGHSQAFVASEKNGRWGKAIKVPGSGKLNSGGEADVYSVSCGAARSCAAGGYYESSAGHEQAFVVNEKNGRWSKAIKVPGSGALNAGGNAQVRSVWCASAGSCVAGGGYADGSGPVQAFVVSENKGRWGKAIKVPGSGALNTGGYAAVASVSCGSAGNCAAGGFYEDGSSHEQAFVVSEKNGRWGKAIEVPGSGALNVGGSAGVESVSCGSAGSCAAGGSYYDTSSHFQAFVVRRA